VLDLKIRPIWQVKITEEEGAQSENYCIRSSDTSDFYINFSDTG
jgi:hypothetical protein